MAEDPDPSAPSQEYTDMEKGRTKIADILAGADAMRKKRESYLKKFPGELDAEYDWRIANTPWRPEFEDALKNLVSRPFARDVIVRGTDLPEQIIGPKPAEGQDRRGGFIDDVDGRGNSLTSFTRNVFEAGIAMGMSAIFVDFPDVDPEGDDDGDEGEGINRPITIAEEKAMNLRPYWIAWDAMQIIALYVRYEGGKVVIEHMRVRETVTERNGFKDDTFVQIRVLEPGRWEVWRQTVVNGSRTAKWAVHKTGTIRRANGNATSVPVALFFTGKVTGAMTVKPPLSQLADMQIELYRAGSRKEEILTYAGSPMLKAKGMSKDETGGPVVVGPRTVLYAPSDGQIDTDWEYLQPDAANIKECRDDVHEIVEDMRRLGLQPALDKTGNPTATGQALDASKAHSTLKSWALSANDAIEQAFVFTAEFLNLQATIQTAISTEFSVIPYNRDALNALQIARQNKDIDHETYLDELMRFGVMRADLDKEQVIEKVAKELEGLQAEIPTDPVTGQPVVIPRGATLI